MCHQCINTTKCRMEDETTGENTGTMHPSSHVDLNLTSLLQRFPADKREAEYKQVQLVLLQHMAALRRIYSKYSEMGVTHSPDNTFILSQLQWWCLLKDCRVHIEGPSLAEVNRLLSTFEEPVDQIHYPDKRLFMRQFLSNLISLGYHIYHMQYKSKSGELAWCLSQLMNNAIIPHACTTRGSVFGDARRAHIALEYASMSWDIYRSLCKTNSNYPHEPTLTARNFLWMLQDFKLISKSLSAAKVLEILSLDNPAISNEATCNLQYELTFLEFFEALVGCAEVRALERLDSQPAMECCTDVESAHSCSGVHGRWSQRELKPQYQLNQKILKQSHVVLSVDNSQGSSAQESSGPAIQEWISNNTYDENTVLDDAWKKHLHTFFVEKLFAAFERNEALKVAVKKEQSQEAERLYHENIQIRQAWEQRMALEMNAMNGVEQDGLNEQASNLLLEEQAKVLPTDPTTKEPERPPKSPNIIKSPPTMKAAVNSKPYSAKDKKKKK